MLLGNECALQLLNRDLIWLASHALMVVTGRTHGFYEPENGL